MTIDIIWKQYRAALKAFLHSKIANAEDVEDLLQDILIKTHQNIHELHTIKNIKSWLFTIANHSIIDFYRKKSMIKKLTRADLWYEEQDRNIKQELSKCISPFIHALPNNQAELLTAIDLNGIPQKEYAQQNGIAYSTLKSRVQKSRQALQHLFEQCCHFTLDKQGQIIDYEQKTSACKKC